jgi:hypothetical protein
MDNQLSREIGPRNFDIKSLISKQFFKDMPKYDDLFQNNFHNSHHAKLLL